MVYTISILFLSFIVKQHDYTSILSFYSIAFIAYFLMGTRDTSHEKWIGRSFVLKLILIFAIPQASDDIYRFYWDGMVCNQGISPYIYLPSEIVSMNTLFTDPDVYQKLNSKEYYSVYPPALQLIFSLTYFMSFKSVYIFSVIWKLVMLLADIGSIYFLKKLQLNSKLIFWYALNPLLMYEVFANGHPEGLLLFFLTGLIWAIKENKLNLRFIFLSCAAAIKIFPLVFFPLLIKKIKISQLIMPSLLAAVLLMIFFLPIYPHQDHLMESLKLYFKKFEFNGSLFELWKWIDYRRFGFDNIDGISSYLSLAFLLILCLFTIRYFKSKDDNFLRIVFGIWLSYLLLATTVHSWYVLPLLLISLFTSSLVGLTWSFLVILSYSWYDTNLLEFKYSFLIAEYGVLILTIVLDSIGKLERLKKKIF